MQPREIPYWNSVNVPLGLLLLASLLAGANACATHAAQDFERMPDHAEQIQGLTTAVGRMAVDLTASYQDRDFPDAPLTEGLVISSFGELKNLSRTSSFGRYLAEQLMGELQRQGHRVVELRKTTNIHVQERRGEYGLSRNAAETPQAVASGASQQTSNLPFPEEMSVRCLQMDCMGS
jgi:hypothetical protein